MHAIIRRYDGVDSTRTIEITGKVNETLVPKLNELPGFAGYYLLDAGNGVLSSFGLFETREQAEEWLDAMAATSICGLGQGAPFPMRNAFAHWPELFELLGEPAIR